MRYATKWPVYGHQWDSMAIRPTRVNEFTNDARFAIEHKARYVAVEATTGVPWAMIACIHRRESDSNFSAWLGNGDPINRKSYHVPAGYGPFSTWEAGAVVALKIDGLTSVHDWTLEKELFYQELFNGAGYGERGLPSPYIWGGTNIQRAGKYVADGQWDGSAWDSQPGCAAILWMIAKLDPTVVFVRETSGPGPVPVPPPPPSPPVPPAHDVTWLQAELNKLGAEPPLQLDGFMGPDTTRAMIAYLSAHEPAA
jgi:lysozyme family protein